MKIAQIVPNWSQFHADKAIGIKAVVRDVTQGLITRGHDVTLFVPDHSTFPGVSLRYSGPSLADSGASLMDSRAPMLQQAYAQRIAQELREFDVVHSHIEQDLLPFIHAIPAPVVSTIHGAGFENPQVEIFRKYTNEQFVALSHRAIETLPYIHFSYVVYNGVDVSVCPYVLKPVESPYIAWMGRITENKGALDAIEAAKRAEMVITLVGFEEKGHDAYFQQVKALEDGASVRLLDAMIGHIKYPFLGNAKALLFPIHWEEPFGLVMVEAMACGTPVIAYNRGSVPEIIRDGVTGFIVDEHKGVAGLVEAIGRIGEIDRAACRKHVEENFTVEKMVDGYERVYKKISGG